MCDHSFWEKKKKERKGNKQSPSQNQTVQNKIADCPSLYYLLQVNKIMHSQIHPRAAADSSRTSFTCHYRSQAVGAEQMKAPQLYTVIFALRVNRVWRQQEQISANKHITPPNLLTTCTKPGWQPLEDALQDCAINKLHIILCPYIIGL